MGVRAAREAGGRTQQRIKNPSLEIDLPAILAYTSEMDRRHFLGSILAAGAGTRSVGVGVEASSSRTVCAFVKFLQSLSFDEWARTMAESGFSGIEATVRKGGQIAPERVEDALPALVKALERHGCELTLMATDVNRADDAVMERTLRMAASLGVRRYRMGYYHDDLEGYLRAS